MCRFVPNKLFKKFSKYTGNWNWFFRFSQNESNSFENIFAKQKHETIFYRNCKKFDNLKFKEALNRELMKHDVNNTDYEFFHGIVLTILNEHAPLKKKHLRANHANFINKRFQKAFMKSEATKTASSNWQNICLLKNPKRSSFEILNVKLVRSNKKLWKNVASLFLNKNIIWNDKKFAETYHGFFSNNGKTLNISPNPYLISETSQTDPVSNPMRNVPNIKNIKNRINEQIVHFP